jgi:hypothetical protein
MLTAFFDIDGLVHHEFVPPGQSVTGHFYVQVLQRLCDALQKRRFNKWQGQWFLHHENAPSHTSLVVQHFLAEKNIPVITQPPYYRISLRVTFGCSLLRNWASMGYVSQPWRTSNRIRRPDTGRFQKKPSTSASNNDRIDGASVWTCKGP